MKINVAVIHLGNNSKKNQQLNYCLLTILTFMIQGSYWKPLVLRLYIKNNKNKIEEHSPRRKYRYAKRSNILVTNVTSLSTQCEEHTAFTFQSCQAPLKTREQANVRRLVKTCPAHYIFKTVFIWMGMAARVSYTGIFDPQLVEVFGKN